MDTNIIDYKLYMGNDYKVYVDVNEDRLKDGRIVPRSFVWEDGYRYKIDKVLDVRPAASLKAGGVGLRYTIRAGNRETYLFLEEDKMGAKWFMERKLDK
jgi:hypothetical protein